MDCILESPLIVQDITDTIADTGYNAKRMYPCFSV